MSGLSFVETAFNAFGLGMAVAGFLLVILEAGQTEDRDRLHRWLARRWRGLVATAWPGLARRLSEKLLAAVNRAIRDYFEEADRRTGFGVLFIGLVFVALPAAAVLNAVVGGSRFLALYYLAIVAVLAALNFAGECRSLALLNTAAALFVGASVFLLIPAYVFRSFADRMLGEVVGHAAIESILVAPLCYIVAYSAMLLFDAVRGRLGGERGSSPVARAVHRFLAALPISFVLTFFAVLAGHLAVAEPRPEKTWPLLISAMGFGAAGLPATLGLVEAALGAHRRLALAAAYAAAVAVAAALSAAVVYFGHPFAGAEGSPRSVINVLAGRTPDGGRIYLGPHFWVAVLPLLPTAVFLAGVIATWLAKAVAVALGVVWGDAIASRKPMLATAALCGLIAALSWGIAASM